MSVAIHALLAVTPLTSEFAESISEVATRCAKTL
jgi:hypothetical protein